MKKLFIILLIFVSVNTYSQTSKTIKIGAGGSGSGGGNSGWIVTGNVVQHSDTTQSVLINDTSFNQLTLKKKGRWGYATGSLIFSDDGEEGGTQNPSDNVFLKRFTGVGYYGRNLTYYPSERASGAPFHLEHTGSGSLIGAAEQGVELWTHPFGSAGDHILQLVLLASHNGNVRIGGNAPTSFNAPYNKLYVYGGQSNLIKFENASAGGETYVIVKSLSDSLLFGLTGGNAFIQSTHDKDIQFYDNSNTALMTVKDGGNVLIGTTSSAPSAKLNVVSTTQGFLPPRMTKAQRDAISSPATGLMIFQTDNTPGLRTYNGTNWIKYTESTD